MAPQHSHAPTLDALLRTKQPLDATIAMAVALLKRRQLRGPDPCARATAHVLAQVVAKAHWADVDQLVARVVAAGRALAAAQPHEPVIGHIVRRVLGLIRGEAEADVQDNDGVAIAAAATATAVVAPTTTPTPLASYPSFSSLPRALALRQPSFPAASPSSMFQLLSGVGGGGGGGSASATASGASSPVTEGGGGGPGGGPPPGLGRLTALRDEILGGIDEIADEIGQADDQIAGFAEAQIRPGDGVLVGGALTRTVEKFLVKAAARRRYTLFLAGTGRPSPALAKRLAAARVDVVMAAGACAATALLPRIHRVVLDARAVAPDGGVLTGRGGARLARAAHARGKTVLVVGGVYRLAPAPWTDPEALIEWASPGDDDNDNAPAPFADGGLVDGIDVARARTEYVPPGLVDVYVTNLGPHSREYLEGVAADHYRAEDQELF